MPQSMASSKSDIFGISTFFLVVCLCFLMLLVLFYVIGQLALPDPFVICFFFKFNFSQRTQMMSFSIRILPPITIAFVRFHMTTVYHHIWKAELLKREQAPHRATALQYYSHEYLESQMHFRQSVSFYSCRPVRFFRVCPSSIQTMLS